MALSALLGGLSQALGSGVEYLTSKRRRRKRIRKDALLIKQSNAAVIAGVLADVDRLADTQDAIQRERLLRQIFQAIREGREEYNKMVDTF